MSLSNFSDEELEKELQKRNKKSNINFVNFLKETLTGKKVDGKEVKNVRLRKEHVKEDNTPQNDWWGEEYDINYLEISYVSGEPSRIDELDDLMKLKIKL